MTQLALSNVGVDFGAMTLFDDITFTVLSSETTTITQSSCFRKYRTAELYREPRAGSSLPPASPSRIRPIPWHMPARSSMIAPSIE